MKSQGETSVDYQYILNKKKNEGQEIKTGVFWGGYQWEGGRHKERVNDGECGICILYSCVKIEK
jgi:hypothetical protein